jgi:hypothetical protein
MSDTVAIAAITAIAGLGSAVIGAYMSHKRTKATFAYERDLRDVEQARQRLDDVLDTGEKLLRVLMDLQPELVVGMFEQADSQLDKAGALNTELAREIRRLMLILTRRDSLVKAVMDYKDSLGPVNRYAEALASVRHTTTRHGKLPCQA